MNDTHLSVLIVDDEEFVRETLAEMISEFDHDVVQVASGAEALEVIQDHNFDMVITDLSMPGMDGWQVARAVRERQSNVQVVLVTGYGASVETPGGNENLIDRTLSKPFDFNCIAELLESGGE